MSIQVRPVSKESIRLFLQQRRSERAPPPSIEEIRQRVGWREGEAPVSGRACARQAIG